MEPIFDALVQCVRLWRRHRLTIKAAFLKIFPAITTATAAAVTAHMLSAVGDVKPAIIWTIKAQKIEFTIIYLLLVALAVAVIMAFRYMGTQANDVMKYFLGDKHKDIEDRMVRRMHSMRRVGFTLMVLPVAMFLAMTFSSQKVSSQSLGVVAEGDINSMPKREVAELFADLSRDRWFHQVGDTVLMTDVRVAYKHAMPHDQEIILSFLSTALKRKWDIPRDRVTAHALQTEKTYGP